MYESISICVVSTSQELCGYFYVACGDGSGAAPRMENYEFTYFIDFFTKSLSFSSLQTMSALHTDFTEFFENPPLFRIGFN